MYINCIIFHFIIAYRTDEGKPWVLPVVRTVEAQMATDVTLNHEYLPVAGMPDFRLAALRLLLGEDSPAIVENRVSILQFTFTIIWLNFSWSFIDQGMIHLSSISKVVDFQIKLISFNCLMWIYETGLFLFLLTICFSKSMTRNKI